MKYLLPIVAILGLSVAGAALALSSPGQVEAAELRIDVVGTGAEENPAVSSPGVAIARFTFDTDTKVLTYVVTVSGISETQVTAAHIHRAAAGTNGPVVYPLSTEPFTITSGSISLTPDDVADLTAGNFYLNVHSQDNPGGFARTQIIFPGLAGNQSGGTVSPPSTGDGGLVGDEPATPWIAIIGLVGLAAASIVVLRGVTSNQ